MSRVFDFVSIYFNKFDIKLIKILKLKKKCTRSHIRYENALSACIKIWYLLYYYRNNMSKTLYTYFGICNRIEINIFDFFK